MSLSFHDYRQFDATGLAQAIRKGDVSRLEVLQAALDRIAAVNPQVNAVTYMHEAAASEAAVDAGSPFAGVPYLIKDLHAPVAACRSRMAAACLPVMCMTSTAKP